MNISKQLAYSVFAAAFTGIFFEIILRHTIIAHIIAIASALGAFIIILGLVTRKRAI